MQEDELLRQILGCCREHDVYAFHVYDSRKTSCNGFPDLVLAGKRGLLFAELKTEYGTLSSSQTDWKYRILASRNIYQLWRPGDLDHAESLIAGL